MPPPSRNCRTKALIIEQAPWGPPHGVGGMTHDGKKASSGISATGILLAVPSECDISTGVGVGDYSLPPTYT